MRLLGHKSIKDELICTQRVSLEGADYPCEAATAVKEAAELFEADYEHVCNVDGVKLLRERKRVYGFAKSL